MRCLLPGSLRSDYSSQVSRLFFFFGTCCDDLGRFFLSILKVFLLFQCTVRVRIAFKGTKYALIPVNPNLCFITGTKTVEVHFLRRSMKEFDQEKVIAGFLVAAVC